MDRIEYNALFVISSAFPYGEAFSSRARNLIKLFNTCGYKVFVIAPQTSGDNKCAELESIDCEIKYVCAPRTVLALSGIGTAKPYMKAVEEISNKEKIDLLISSAMVHVNDSLYKWSRKNHIPYIMEQCEWYDKSTFKFGKYNPYYREHIRLIEKKNKRVDGIIAISTLFEQHYNSQNVPTLRMPTILDIDDISYKIVDKKKNYVNIVFAGSLGKGKEDLSNVIKALKIINSEQIEIVLDIYGTTRDQLEKNIDNNGAILAGTEEYINIRGRIPQSEVESKLREADFSIFIRPTRKSSDAGFPTKLAESMSVGTPVITNNTGDISLYLHDGENGYIPSENSEEAILKVFNRIMHMSEEDLIHMRKKARITANDYFSYEKYREGMLELIRAARERAK